MRWSVPRLVLVALAVAILATVGVTAATSTASLGLYNPSWDGASQFSATAAAEGVDDRLVRDTERFETIAPEGTLAVVLSPDSGYEVGEVTRLEAFVRSGGTLLVAADFRDPGPALLAGLGTNASVSGLPVRDEHRYGPGPAFPLAPNVSDHPYTDGVAELVLNHPSAIDLRPGEGATGGGAAGSAEGPTVLVESSPFAYLDRNRNEELDDEEELARHPVVTVESLGEGAVVVVSDPSLFINAMLERGDNRRFLANVVGAHDQVVVDVSHTSALPPLISLRLVLRDLPIVQLVLGGGLLGGVAAIGRRWRGVPWARLPGSERLRPGGEPAPARVDLSGADVAAAVRERHPEWDEERVERVTEGIIRRGKKESTDD